MGLLPCIDVEHPLALTQACDFGWRQSIETSLGLQEIFGADCTVALTDPVYPAYVDSNVMAGRAGRADEKGRYDRLVYLPATADNGFRPALPSRPVDLIYLCYPNNPTGAVLGRDALREWVQYALKHRAVILYDAAYEAYIRDADIPHSIFEIDGARECAIEFRSFSKTAGPGVVSVLPSASLCLRALT